MSGGERRSGLGRCRYPPTLAMLIACSLAVAVAGCGGQPSEPAGGAGPVSPPVAESPPPELSPEAAALLGQLEALRRAHREEEALDLARAFLAEHPGTPRLHFAIGVLYGSKEDHRAAIEELTAELAADPGHFESHRGLAAAHALLGDPSAALPHLETCLAMRPGHVDIRFRLGRELSALGRWDEAEPHLAAAAAALDDAESWSELGLLHRRRGDLQAAIGDFRQALERDPGHPASLLNLGQLLVRTGDAEAGAELLERHRQRALLEDRLDHLRRSSRLPGATAANFAALADAQVRSGDRNAAITSYRRALERDPELAPAALGLASVLLDRGDVEEATRWSVVALMAAPDSLRTHYVLGMVRLAKGQHDAADRAFEASRQRGEWGAEAHLRVAAAYLRAGELERAEREIGRAAAVAPRDPALDELRGRLARARETAEGE